MADTDNQIYRASHGFGGRNGVLFVAVTTLPTSGRLRVAYLFTQPEPWPLDLSGPVMIYPSKAEVDQTVGENFIPTYKDNIVESCLAQTAAEITTKIIESKNPILAEYLRVRGMPSFEKIADADWKGFLLRHVIHCGNSELAALKKFAAAIPPGQAMPGVSEIPLSITIEQFTGLRPKS